MKNILREVQNFNSRITGVVQHSYNPISHETIQFFAFEKRRLRYIISTYRTNTIERISSENNVMKEIIACCDKEIIKSIVFSLEVLEIDTLLFRVQKYIEKSNKYIKNVQHFNVKYIEQILYESNVWIGSFQNIKTIEYKDSTQELNKELNVWKENVDGNKKKFLLGIQTLAEFSRTKLSKSSSHGDYCYWNYFKGIDDNFYVFDWEFAQRLNWTFIDPITNIFVFWMDLYKQGQVSELDKVLNDSNNALERVLYQALKDIEKRYDIKEPDLPLYILFVYCHLYLRQKNFEKELPLFDEMNYFLNNALKKVY